MGPVQYVDVSAHHDLLDAKKPAWPMMALVLKRFLAEFEQIVGR